MATLKNKSTWLVTGGAGFIGSHIVEQLLSQNQHVIALDNFASGKKSNLLEAQRVVGGERAANLKLIEGDIRDASVCQKACQGVDYVLHLAALGSVPRSMAEPQLTFEINAQGFINVLDAARLAGAKRVVYSSSSAVYGDDETLPKKEENVGHVLSPYAASKKMNELSAEVYHRCYGMTSLESPHSQFSVVGLRYFNVFGPRQSPDGPYAAVVPQWILKMVAGHRALIYGDGSTSRDFCHVGNVVDANLLAAFAEHKAVSGRVFNIALGARMTLLELHSKILRIIESVGKDLVARDIEFAPWRLGDIRHSHADISRAKVDLQYAPRINVDDGLRETVAWFLKNKN